MTGQHRAPSAHHSGTHHSGAVAAAAVLAAGTGAGLVAIPPPPAEAAPSSAPDWDRLAQCEGGGDWAAVDRSGSHRGGLQFSASTWAAFGGRVYAASADRATRAQQITVAQRVLDAQGIGAWPVCGPRSLSHTASQAHPQAQRRTTAPAPRATTRTPHTTAPRSSARATTPHTTAPRTAARAPEIEHPSGPLPADPMPDYLVRAGDHLSGIAAARHVPGGWHALRDANPVISDPNLIFPGQHLQMPTSGAASSSRAAPHEERTTGPQHGSQSQQQDQPRPLSQGPARSRTLPQTPPAPATTLPTTSHTLSVLTEARHWIGTPYRWGGTSRSGVDCSGLVLRVFAAAGKALPRTADAQMHATRLIPRANAVPGDLIFSLDRGGHAYHVGIVVGNGQMIDAPQTGSTVGIHSFYRAPTTVFGRVR